MAELKYGDRMTMTEAVKAIENVKGAGLTISFLTIKRVPGWRRLVDVEITAHGTPGSFDYWTEHNLGATP